MSSGLTMVFSSFNTTKNERVQRFSLKRKSSSKARLASTKQLPKVRPGTLVLDTTFQVSRSIIEDFENYNGRNVPPFWVVEHFMSKYFLKSFHVPCHQISNLYVNHLRFRKLEGERREPSL